MVVKDLVDGKINLSEQEIIELMWIKYILEKMAGLKSSNKKRNAENVLEKPLGESKADLKVLESQYDEIEKKLVKIGYLVENLEISPLGHPPNNNVLKTDVPEDIKEIKSHLKFEENIRSGEILEKGSFFLKAIPTELKLLKNRNVPESEYFDRRAILQFSLLLAKIYFKSIERQDYTNIIEGYLDEASGL